MLESLKYILKKEGFYNSFVVLWRGYRKLKKINFFTSYWWYNKINIEDWDKTKNHPLIRKRMGLREIARELNEKGVPKSLNNIQSPDI